MLDASTSLPNLYAADGAPRRRYPRYQLGRWIELCVDGDDFHCFAEDISYGGARLATVILAEGEIVTLHMILPQPDGESCLVVVEGIVVWTSGSQAGVRFLRTPEDFAILYAAAVELNPLV